MSHSLDACRQPKPAARPYRYGCQRSLRRRLLKIITKRLRTTLCPPSAGGPVQYYQATIHRVGAQVGFSSNVALGWAVFAPTLSVGPGALAGVYGGVSAGAAIGVGANGLVGGNNSFALQPVSVEGQSGLNLVATATQLQLHAAAVPADHYRHHRHYR